MMPTNASRDDWALHLARFAACLRPDWDVPGVRAAIHNARHLGTREDIAHALIELTRRDDLRTPALLAQDGAHWRTGRTPDARPPVVRCTVAGHEYENAGTCRLCPHERLDPTDAPTLGLSEAQIARNRAGAARVRAALTASPEPYTDHALAAAHDMED